MKRLTVYLALAGAIALTSSNAAQAAYCRCAPAVTTPTMSSSASNCTTATGNLQSNLWAYISCYICRDPVMTSSCTFSGGEDPYFIATGSASFRCYQVGGGCEIP